MARISAAKSSFPSRIRFIMFDAEIADGDIGPITQAIQNALRVPAPATVQKLPSPSKAQDTNSAYLHVLSVDWLADRNPGFRATAPRLEGKKVFHPAGKRFVRHQPHRSGLR